MVDCAGLEHQLCFSVHQGSNPCLSTILNINRQTKTSMLRVIKAKYFDRFKDSYDTISPSRSCPHQGYFYDDDYDFNEPHDEQSGPKMRG